MEDFSQSRLSGSAKTLPQNRSNSSGTSKKKEVLPFSPTVFLKSFLAWKILFRAMAAWGINATLRFRNRPGKILSRGDDRLKEVSEDWDFTTTSRRERDAIVRKLLNTLLEQDYGGKLGIAAPQIGVNKRVIIVLGEAMFNPQWNPVRNMWVEMVEGCYSLPKDAIFKVKRAKYGWASWRDIDGVLHEEKLTELRAIVFQHEFSHLEGKCCDELGEKIKQSQSKDVA